MNKKSRVIATTTAGVVLAAGAVYGLGPSIAEAHAGGHRAKPTVVLVHGAFADSSGWNDVVRRLQDDGYPVVAVANPLRGVASDAAVVRSVVDDVDGPVVLVGHSYAGNVITEAASGDPKVTALVYVAAFLPDTGESAGELSNKFPGSTLAPTLHQIGSDLYIDQAKFPQQFAADVPARTARLLAVSQRPIDAAALAEPETGTPAWKTIPSYALIPTADKNIPAAAQYWMAARAHAEVTVAKGASHLVLASQPEKTAAVIERAAREHS
ncbi:alpha/beta fold hydrolase [Actinoplanes sp. L3-i22]|uniref:alpha/beta fold hydrolase n=1 Tax=Actinoplanes sp. L3-i22 TaxID=2836373 RepID=UPI001C75A0CC|nr:alpha/beta hydrolase [Actinoplanes sp. L3-i22]BCY08228.1 alpha/beta hydrolase [Actinoplanes sp. L3-i22]